MDKVQAINVVTYIGVNTQLYRVNCSNIAVSFTIAIVSITLELPTFQKIV